MAAMRKSTIGALIGLLSVGCGDPSDGQRDDAPESEQAERGSGFFSVQFAVEAKPASLGTASVSIFNALGETCEGASCKAYPLNQAYFQATAKGTAKFVGWSGCSFVELGHFSAATFLENVGVLDETCTANFADASGTAPESTPPSRPPSFPNPGIAGEDVPGQQLPSFPTPSTPNDAPGQPQFPSFPKPSTPKTPEGGKPDDTTPGETTPGETTPGEATPGMTKPGQTTPGKTKPQDETPDEQTPDATPPGMTKPGTKPQEPTPEGTPDTTPLASPLAPAPTNEEPETTGPKPPASPGLSF
jgi:hypothetical protein